jgi:restriction system protein
MKSYYRLMLGPGGKYAKECHAGGFVGIDYEIQVDLTNDLPDQWESFNRKFIPIYMAGHPGKTKVAAGLACGSVWTVAKGIINGDVVLCPEGSGRYQIGEVDGDYRYEPGKILPHRRSVKWLDEVVDRSDMSQALKLSTGSYGSVVNITGYRDEIEQLIQGLPAVAPVASDEGPIEDPLAFAMESHLEDFLVKNWAHTELGKDYDIYADNDGVMVGKQYMTDTGPLDILAISKDKERLLVVELKKGRASDVVVGQTLRYMGYVQAELAETTQKVEGMIIAFEDDKRIRRALSVTPGLTFCRYQVDFKLVKS